MMTPLSSVDLQLIASSLVVGSAGHAKAVTSKWNHSECRN